MSQYVMLKSRARIAAPSSAPRYEILRTHKMGSVRRTWLRLKKVRHYAREAVGRVRGWL